MDLKYANACKEVLTLFDYFLDENEFSKIPEKQIEYMKENSNLQHTYIVDETKSLEEQKISKEAKAIIVSLYKKYFINDEQKKKVDEIVYILDRQKNTVITNNFNKSIEYKNVLKNAEKVEVEEKALIKSESMWKRIINRILQFIHVK